jgi:hypothetical protein
MRDSSVGSTKDIVHPGWLVVMTLGPFTGRFGVAFQVHESYRIVFSTNSNDSISVKTLDCVKTICLMDCIADLVAIGK